MPTTGQAPLRSAILPKCLPWMVAATVMLIVIALGPRSGPLLRRQEAVPARVIIPLSDAEPNAASHSSSDASPSASQLSVQDDWTVAYHWSHDVPRGGVLTLKLESSGRLAECRQRQIGGESVKSSRTVDGRRMSAGLAATVGATERFTFEGARPGNAYDVPQVAISLKSGSGELGVEFDNWYAVEPAVASAIRGFVELTGVSPEAPPRKRNIERFIPRPGTDWRLALTIRDAAGHSVECIVNEDRDLTVHGELSEEIVGWYSATLEGAEVQKLLEVSSRLFNDFRFRPNVTGGADPLDVTLSLQSVALTIKTRERYESPGAVSASGYGSVLRLIARGRAAAFWTRLPRELLGE